MMNNNFEPKDVLGGMKMELKMYQFDGGVMTWVCATNEKEAINIFKTACGEDVWEESKECFGEQAVIELHPDHLFTYYHDGINPEKDTIKNIIKKYCTKPDMFATSDF
jgi:hypothetical protein